MSHREKLPRMKSCVDPDTSTVRTHCLKTEMPYEATVCPRCGLTVS